MSGKAFGNATIAARLTRTADLLEIDGANTFRVRAYRAAAERVAGHPEALAAIVARGGDLTAIPGIGKDLAAGIQALLREGELPALTDLTRRIPVGLLDVVRVPGVGSKRAAKLHAALGITSLDDLERAAQAGEIARQDGFGAKTQAAILAGIALVRRGAGRVRRDVAEAALAPLRAAIAAAPGTIRVEIAGSLRRGRDSVADVDLLALSDDPGATMAALCDHPDVATVLAAGETKSSVRLETDLQIDLRIVPAASFGAAWQYFTGSQAHNVALRRRAQERGFRLSEYGLEHLDGSGVTPTPTEADVYAALGLAFIPPELREDRGEITAAETGALPRLIDVGDVLGELHAHTTWSDGSADVAAMRAAAQARGLQYLAITDHSQRLRMTGGLDAARLALQGREIASLDADSSLPRLLRGLEVDILEDGSLDMDDATLAQLDVVVASAHGYLDLPREQQTERILRAIAHPAVNVLGHPTGRLIGSREGMALDLDAIFAAAARHRVAIECNASPARLDASDQLLLRAVAAGCRIAICTDAHTPEGLDDLRHGIATARRGWLTADHVINAWPLPRLITFLAKESS
jgi:DNA polymerase (family X)